MRARRAVTSSVLYISRTLSSRLNLDVTLAASRSEFCNAQRLVKVSSRLLSTSTNPPNIISQRSYSRLSSETGSRRPHLIARRQIPIQEEKTSIQPATPIPQQLIPTVPLGLEGVLNNPVLVITRQLEMLNVLIGFEQANKYAIKNAAGTDVGFIAEEETAFTNVLMRQLLRTRRPFEAVILDAAGNIVLKVKRPLKWFLNSQLFIHDAQDNVIGEVQQVWHLWRRKYNVFVGARQFGIIDAGFWSWDFFVQDRDNTFFGAIQRQFGGFAREIFTDTGAYYLRMDGLDGTSTRPITLDERAVLLGTAINIDIDYFSRHSGNSGMGIPLPFFGGGSDARSPTTTSEGVPPVPSSGGSGGFPMPIIIPGGFGGYGGSESSSDIGSSSSESTPSSSPPPSPPPTPTENQWGDEVAPRDEPFISDDDAGMGQTGQGGSSWTDFFGDQ
ncbi:hypothetical protein SmJEL517_g04268 [Synchytrium microbalum]|uniref:Phospholipid scramblase n=1 Tax=Synchytrium microbalum TaxID=1806994 RepID=A0A507BZP0_9FUNG|nr:uncharacterized protein SmJEL517_g04268 [Synchytrium microbalum]TPX32591.1 hypothetical protein SmJEL517_g04268 [Synchytrium microbalum]